MKPTADDLISRNPTGRPTKKNHDVIVDIIRDVSLGLPLKEAASRAGVHPATLRRWRAEDESLDRAVEAARASFLARNVQVVQEAATTDWKAAAWLLERRAPGEFGKRHVVEVDREPISVVDPLTGEILGPGSPIPEVGGFDRA